MNSDGDARTPTEVIRCVYLARMAELRGQPEAARRWQAKADRWLARYRFSSRPDGTEKPAQPQTS